MESLVGREFGKLKVVKLDHIGKLGASFWVCQCQCGNQRVFSTARLETKKYQSCRCSRKYKGLLYGEASLNALFRSYKFGAKNRDLEFSISFDEFKEIISKNCYYCGKPPSQEKSTGNCFGKYIYNGIDRTNNSIGYVSENIVPCCKTCNRAKNVMNIDDFKKWIFSVADNLSGKQDVN